MSKKGGCNGVRRILFQGVAIGGRNSDFLTDTKRGPTRFEFVYV